MDTATINKSARKLWRRFKLFYDEHRTLFAVISGSVVFAVFFIASWSRLDADFGWHLTTGNYILKNGIPHHDIYTYTARNHPWVDHEWGNDVILALLYNTGGYLLSALFFAMLWTVGLILIGWRSRAWILFIAALAIAPYAGIRPIAWSVLLFSLTLRILRINNKSWRWALPIIFLPWANLHAGFIAGLALIIYFAVMELDWKLLAILLLAAGATLVNAYGTGVYVEIAHTIFDPKIHNQIAEWRYFYIVNPSKPYVYLWVLGFLAFAQPRWRRFIGLGPLLLLTGLSASRNIPFFVVATVSDLNSYVTIAIKKSLRFKTPLMIKFSLVGYFFIAAIVLVYIVFSGLIPTQSRTYGYPIKEVAYLKQHACNGHLFNDYDYGGFLIWKLPSSPDYIDGRMVTWVNHMNNYLNIINNPKKYYPAQFAKYNIRCALLSMPRDYKLNSILVQRGWKTVLVSKSGPVLLEEE